MNFADELRMVKEEQTLMDYTKIETEPDIYRGHPNFWKLPLELFNKNDPCGRSYLFKPLSLEEQGIVPTLERVGMPDAILKEKRILPRTRNLWEKWSNFQYRKLKIMELEAKLEKIQPHRPDYAELIVIGNKTEMQQQTSTYPDDIESSDDEGDGAEGTTVKETEATESKAQKTMEPIKSKGAPALCLIIDGFSFIPHELRTAKVFLLAFTDFKVNSKTLQTKYLCLENKGSIPLKLSFKKISTYNLFHDLIPYRQKGITFFFERSDLILTPGQKLNYPFKFTTSKPGNYDETWEICTNPKLWKAPAKVILKLKGFADTGDAEKCAEIVAELDNNMRESLVKDTLRELLENVESASDPVSILHYYDQARLFETINSSLTAYGDRPKYKYNEVVIRDFKNLYDSIKNETSPPEWNYSIHDLRSLALHYDLNNNEDGKNALSEVDSLVKHLQAACEWPCRKDQVYNIFSSFLRSSLTKICSEISNLERDLGITFQPRYRCFENNELRQSSFERAERRFSEAKAISKRRISKSDDASRKLRRNSRGASSQRLSVRRNSSSRRRRSKESSILELTEEADAITINLPQTLSAQYKYNLYVIFYTNLCNAIDAIESALINKEVVVPHISINKLEETKAFQEKYSRKSVFDLTELISEILSSETNKMKPSDQSEIENETAFDEETALSSYPSRQKLQKLISYPETIFRPLQVNDEVIDMDVHSVSTLEGGKLDPNWLDFKEVAAQTSSTSVEYDLVQKVEILQDSTSLQNVEYNREVACQKNEQEHVSDEEYFYPSAEEV